MRFCTIFDVLTSYHEYTSLDKWIDDARAYSCDPVIQDYYEKNARNLITTWGGTLNDLCQSDVVGAGSRILCCALGYVHRCSFASGGK